MAAQDLAPTIGTSAQQPKRVKTDALEAEAVAIESEIRADRYLAAKAARVNPLRGIMLCKLIPAAGNPDQQGTQSNTGSFSNFDGGIGD